jgi:hypothetical protein
VAYATEERGSEANTGSASVLGRSCSWSSSDASGRPISDLFKIAQRNKNYLDPARAASLGGFAIDLVATCGLIMSI